MIAKIVFFVALIQLAAGQSCLNITGSCVLGMCPTGQSCLSNVCCITDPAMNCANQLPESFCEQNAAKCNDATLGASLKVQCAQTCKTCTGTSGTTGSTTCVDIASNCATNANLCSNAVYKDLMTKQCPLTCKICSSSTTGSSSCADKVNPATGVSDCTKDEYLCNNAAYYNLMTQQCPKTCGRC